ncbi:hypothetical protein K7711_02905 [Nocardia sp. CA2R105]|uniref:hypothetical protein n=1 Tax=Nocardia coffeae TaxID=2873381 RepID=UPI001CA71DDF|nr:hypothetical protein [Nocardia coffeae]MBY8855417.1 hypothetical protein [Nocardia coffeae]
MKDALASGLLSLLVAVPVSVAVLIATVGAVFHGDRERRKTAVEVLRVLLGRNR